MKNNIRKAFIGGLAGVVLAVSPAFAHVVVKPNQVGVAAFQTFTIGVPNEKDNPTVSVRLLVPYGLTSVTPNVKPGWTITVKKTGEGENAVVTEITWTNGSIPVDQRDEFLFSAQAPTSETVLSWKAYETYKNGEVVSWDVDPASPDVQDMQALEKAGKGPYSVTKVVNDLSASGTPASTLPNPDSSTMSMLAIVLSVIAIGLQFFKKKP